jgi:bacillithiol biosynthesis cysteine-adding enzyme BshC
MQILTKEYSLPQLNRLTSDYVSGKTSALQFFHYSPHDPTSINQRYGDIMKRSFPRDQLANVIEHYISRWTISDAQRIQLERLRQDNSVVVIGGQQAGLLTGPLYTMYKVMTIIHLAKKQEERLGVPVVPVFWIAGEDHDFDEINHVYMPRPTGDRMQKVTMQDEHSRIRQSISQRRLPKTEVESWLEEVYSYWKETEFSAEVKQLIGHSLDQAKTYVDFFAGLLHFFFAKHGLLLIDSADPALRLLESDPFQMIIHNYREIDLHVRQEVARMKQTGYTPQLELGEKAALLFVHHDQERLLLELDDGLFKTKDGRFTYTEKELIKLANEEPWQLSNNVITRPFMQEVLFPTLCFVAGPGEVAYWALFRRYFEHLGLLLPVIIPRLQITLVEPHIANMMKKYNLDMDTVIHSFETFKKKWLAEQDELDLDRAFQMVKREINALYQPLIEKIGHINRGLIDLGHKNLNKVLEQVDYLHKRSAAEFKTQHEAALRQFDKIKQAIYPEGKLQERMFNPFYFFNKYGVELLDVLMDETYDYNDNHKLVYLR